jgi:aldose 1-epimerase
MRHALILLSIILIAAYGCKPKEVGLSISKAPWGTADGKEVNLYTLKNAKGMEVKITNFGGIVTAIMAPDKNGNFENVVLGLDSLSQYQANTNFLGITVGRYANRIAKGKFTLNGVEYTLATNNGANHLHGGVKGFGKVVWDAKEITGADSVALELTYLSKDMEEGYPGNLTSKVTYVLTNNNELKIYYEAETDKPTVINLTNHSYFNLSACKESILGEELKIYGDSITPTDSTLIPTGEIKATAGTGFDFSTTHKIGERIDSIPGGYDINYKLNRAGSDLTLAVELYDPTSGRFMETYTTEPGMQFYSGNFLDGTITGQGGVVYQKYYGLCLEAQKFPDSPNQPKFPTTTLNPDEKYTQLTIYKFSVK